MAKDILSKLEEIRQLRSGSAEEQSEASERLKDLALRHNDRLRVQRTRSKGATRAKELKQLATSNGITTCEGCGWSVPDRIGNRVMHMHHVVPVANGGNNKRSNLVVICPNCHVIAHALIDRFADRAPRDRDSLLAALKADPLALLTGR